VVKATQNWHEGRRRSVRIAYRLHSATRNPAISDREYLDRGSRGDPDCGELLLVSASTLSACETASRSQESVVATGHDLLDIAYHVLAKETTYQERRLLR